ncbi:hypothetical protein GCWU000282_01836 [Catonella morbi ATCC 51271]|uniref:Uncharacterized protein n=1 Tax=Catonella morbi ATCC 51271 TaxID=592026 RepID=V2Z7Q4_9FIRM|nr:hypothetical protein GCWU000282_01836 [Catonella morbi ATCC 51271]
MCFHPLSGFSSYFWTDSVDSDSDSKFSSPIGVFFLFLDGLPISVKNIIVFIPYRGFLLISMTRCSPQGLWGQVFIPYRGFLLISPTLCKLLSKPLLKADCV